MQRILAAFEHSKTNGTGITLYFSGQTLSIVVREVLGVEAVVGRNQQFDQIVVKLDGLIAVASQ